MRTSGFGAPTLQCGPFRWLVLLVFAAPCHAQELSPRAYWPVPDGTQLLMLGYARSSGDVVTDPSLPVVGVDSTINRGLLAYLQTTSFLGRTSTLSVELPYARGHTSGIVDGEPRRRDFSSFGDLALGWSVNIRGAPSMTTAEFIELVRNPRPILALGARLVVPSGDYDENRLINVGGNRWALKTELGYIRPVAPEWLFELELGAWFFGDNDEFLGVTRKQDPVYAAELHMIRNFAKGHWFSIEANFFRGGRSEVGGLRRDDLQRNANIGATLVRAVGTRHAFKLGINTGVVTESGGDYSTLVCSYIYRLR